MSPPTDHPSPTPSATITGKRSRASGSVAPGGAARANKRKKPEGSMGPDSGAEGRQQGGQQGQSQRPAFGVGMVKGREDEWTEPGDVKTKINFLDLPVDALYKYLELNDLVPRWDPSPWSEAPCEPPTSLYLNYPQAPGVNIVSGSPKAATPLDDPGAVVDEKVPVEDMAKEGDAAVQEDEGKDGEEGGEEGSGGDGPAPPTTRSKTAPQRKRTPEQGPLKRGVFTLSDVHATRAILAAKANQHWMKGLGGGQNRESETIVNFLYKNKVGHGRLLRVYNPTHAPFS